MFKKSDKLWEKFARKYYMILIVLGILSIINLAFEIFVTNDGIIFSFLGIYFLYLGIKYYRENSDLKKRHAFYNNYMSNALEIKNSLPANINF